MIYVVYSYIDGEFIGMVSDDKEQSRADIDELRSEGADDVHTIIIEEDD